MEDIVLIINKEIILKASDNDFKLRSNE